MTNKISFGKRFECNFDGNTIVFDTCQKNERGVSNPLVLSQITCLSYYKSKTKYLKSAGLS